MFSRSVLSIAAWGIALGALPAHADTMADFMADGGLAATLSSASPSASENAGAISDIRIEGNQRIEKRTILTYLGLAPGQSFNQGDVNEGLKNLFATGFFSDVKLLRQGNTLIVQVEENPVISRVVFEGNDRIETSDLEKEIELQARSIYSRDKVQSDVYRILNIYRRSGRYNAIVEPKLIKHDQNRVDLVYEITEGPVAKVEKITFIGNAHFSNDTLRKAIRTEETAWYKLLTDNDKYDPDRLLYDQELLTRFYLNEGFIDFQVKSANAELSADKRAFYLTFVVEEGPQYRFGDIKVVNQLKAKEPPDFSKMITTKSGKIYTASKVEESIDAMTAELGNRGYAFVDIQPKLERDPEKKIAHLSYVVRPGPRVYVERINITGNVRTLDEVVRREFRLSEGDPYNASKLQRSEQRINNLGFFEKIEMKSEEGSAPDKTVVNVNVQEKSTGEVNLGAGFSSLDGVLAQVGVGERNLLGRGQDLRANLTLSRRRKQARMGFTEPYFLDRELAAGFDIYRLQENFSWESSFISDSTGITLRGRYALLEKLQHSLYYSARRNIITDVPQFASAFIRGQLGNHTYSAVGHTLAYDDRDNRFLPNKGYFVSLQQEFAGVGGNSNYVKHELKTSYYHTIYPKWIFGFLGSAGNIYTLNNNPVRINERFFLGGDDFRGFQTFGVGPRDISTTDTLGGNSYYVGTLELRFPLGLPDELGLSGAVFGDAGSLWDNNDVGPNIADINSLRASGGASVLWSSPFGPIRIDMAHAFVKERFDRTENLRFSFGTRF